MGLATRVFGSLGGTGGKMIGSQIGRIGGKKGKQWGAKTGYKVGRAAGEAFGNAILGSLKKGGRIKKTGLYRLHKGELVVPAGKKHKRRR